MLRYRTANGLVDSTARGRCRLASGQSIAFGPSSGGGQNFNFYLDADLTTAANSFVDGTPLVLGTRLVSSQNIYSLGVRWLAPTTNPTATLRARLFNNVQTAALIKDVTFTLPELSVKHFSTGEWVSLYWHEVYWNEPVLIPASETWTHAVVTNAYVGRPFFHDGPIVRGAITSSSAAGRFNTDSTQYPSSQFNSNAYFVDGIFSLTA